MARAFPGKHCETRLLLRHSPLQCVTLLPVVGRAYRKGQQGKASDHDFATESAESTVEEKHFGCYLAGRIIRRQLEGVQIIKATQVNLRLAPGLACRLLSFTVGLSVYVLLHVILLL